MSVAEIIDPEFRRYVLKNAPLKQLATGFDWVEGPVWFGDADCLYFSDIPSNRILRWNDAEGLSTYRAPSNYANGQTRDRQGRLITCEHGPRRVTRTEWDGSITVIADAYQGKRLNSPNDVVVKSDGTIWFTDPHYGIGSNYEGFKSEQELPCNVYRVDPSTGSIEAVATDFDCPNGLVFSPDEARLYIAESGHMYDLEANKRIRVFDVGADNTLAEGRDFHKVDPGHCDGMRCDDDGNIWTSAADGVQCIAPDGRLLGKIHVPELVSNICFGGRAKHRLFITATTSLYSVILNRSGAQQP